MNIEELELSLRTEFEGQLRSVLAGIKQDVSEFQKKFETEFEEHRTKLDRTIGELSSRMPETVAFDAAFNESVGEHLRLARDDGAQVAAVAFGEAEKLRETEVPAAGGFDLIRDAINEISSKNTQATILQALVEQASNFAARGAFFIVKNDHFVGWKVFGSEARADDGGVRDVLFGASADTLLAASIRSMCKATAVAGEYSDDSLFLDALSFGSPAEMHAIPLMARGRGVAVLYADAGNAGSLNVEALETLVRVAGLTVELLAASQAPAPAPAVQPAPVVERVAEPAVETAGEVQHEVAQPAEESYAEQSYESDVPQVSEPEPAPAEASEFEPIAEPVTEAEPQYEAVESVVADVEEYTGEVTYELEQTVSYADKAPEPEPETVETFETVSQPEVTEETEEAEAKSEPVAEFAFSSGESFDASYQGVEEPVAEETAIPMVEAPAMPLVGAPAVASLNGNGHAEVATVAEPVVEVASAQPRKSRFSDRNVDLPIEVPESERRLHNDARRFARLLVSEIKLYNEQKVTEGRESNDLYDRLREAIDRSREMYDKRVQPAVASKFDYFHYEVVNSLADGQDSRLGASYPGANV